MTHWITNVPETRIKHTHTLTLTHAQEVKKLLGFIQQTQDHVSMDHLMEEILAWYFKRKHFDFPLYGETEKLQFTLPESMDADLHTLVEARHQHDPEATITHVMEHAVERYLDSHGALSKAWREEKRRREREEKDAKKKAPERSEVVPERAPPGEARVEEPARTTESSSTTSVSSPYARPVGAPARPTSGQNEHDVSESGPSEESS